MSRPARRVTTYAAELARASFIFPNGSEGRIERLRFEQEPYAGQEGVRFSWWKNGRFMPRPLDATENELLALLSQAIERGVFSQRFLADLLWKLLGQALKSPGGAAS